MIPRRTIHPRKPNGKTMNSNHKAFTLVELILAIALTVILLMLLQPRGSRARESARRANCMSNVRNIGLAFKQYAVDNNDSFPAIVTSNNGITSTSVFLSLTNGNYLMPGRIYLCPSENYPYTSNTKIASVGPGNFTSTNNSYACVVSNASGIHGLNESMSSDNPLILDRGLIGTPGSVIHLGNTHWNTDSPHKVDGGNIFYVGGHAAFRKNFDTGADGTNGYVLEP